MKKTSKPGRPSSPFHVELRGLFARVWVACLLRATGAADLKELAQICNELLPEIYPRATRLSRGAAHVADAAGNLRPVSATGIGRGLAALMDGYLTGPVNPADVAVKGDSSCRNG